VSDTFRVEMVLLGRLTRKKVSRGLIGRKPDSRTENVKTITTGGASRRGSSEWDIMAVVRKEGPDDGADMYIKVPTGDIGLGREDK
jgi:hypothetical protein